MNKYELVWILAGNASQEMIDMSMEKIGKLVKDLAGKMDETYFWDQRTLAYPIKKNNVGNYCIAKFSLDGKNVLELSEALRVDSSILRYLISRKESKETRKESKEKSITP